MTLKNCVKKLICGVVLVVMATCVAGLFSGSIVLADQNDRNKEWREKLEKAAEDDFSEFIVQQEKELDNTSNQIEQELKILKSSYIGATGVMIRPAPGPITSPYSKTKVHPVFGAVRPHNGTDIGAPHGHEICAVDNGIVIYADWRDNYGWTTILDHGNGLTTLYAHQSKLVVNIGDEVVKGDVIGYVGSTGYSTGPHLHFEVRRDGELRDPYHYIPY